MQLQKNKQTNKQEIEIKPIVKLLSIMFFQSYGSFEQMLFLYQSKIRKSSTLTINIMFSVSRKSQKQESCVFVLAF